MTKETLAALLDGREYGNEITEADVAYAKANGLVVVYGASEDLMEFDGAIRDEASCWEGDVIPMTAAGPFVSECEDDGCPYAERERAKCKTIEAVWCAPDGPTWTYKTDIPHATFNIMEDGEVYCRGIVFRMEDLK